MDMRGKILINRPFQLKFSLYVCSWVLGLSLIYPIIIYNLCDFFFHYIAADPNGPQIEVLKEWRLQMMFIICGVQLVFMALTFLISLIVSHRIAGPLYKLGKSMEQAADGNLEPVRFRNKDYFRELEVSFNHLLDGLRSQKSLNSKSDEPK